MKSSLATILLSLPLTVLAQSNGLDQFLGQYARKGNNADCVSKIVIETYRNRLMVYNLSSGQRKLDREIHNERVQMGDILVEGSIKEGILKEERFKIKKAIGVNIGKKLQQTTLVSISDKTLNLQTDNLKCSYGIDLPEVTQAPVSKPQEPKPEVRANEPLPTVEVGGIEEVANTDYIPLKRYYKNGDDLLDVRNAEEILKTITRIKSATDKYHNDLADLIQTKDSLTADEIILALNLSYFNSSDLEKINKRIGELKNPKTKEERKTLDILTQNKFTATTYSDRIQASISQDFDKKVGELSIDDSKKIIESLIESGYSSDNLVDHVIAKIKNITTEQKLELIPLLEKKNLSLQAANIATAVFKEKNTSYSTDDILTNPIALSKEASISRFIEGLATNVNDPSLDNFLKLVAPLKNSAQSLSNVAKKFLKTIPWTSPDEIITVANNLKNGSYSDEAYKDDFVMAAILQIKPVSIEQAEVILKLIGYNSKRAGLFDLIITRLAEPLSVDSFMALDKQLTNGNYSDEKYRDDAIMKHYTKIPNTKLEDNLPIIDLISTENKKKVLASGIWNRSPQKDVNGLISLSSKLNNGNYSDEKYRDDMLVEGIKSVPKFNSSTEITSYVSKLSNGPLRLSQLTSQSSKIPSIAVSEIIAISSLLTNGNYSDENYRDQSIILLMGKSQLTGQADLTSLLKLMQQKEFKIKVLANGISSLTLSTNDLSLLVANEADSDVKLKMITAFAPKIKPLTVQQADAIAKTVRNGNYGDEQYRSSSIDLLINLMAISSIEDLKAALSLRSESIIRLGYYKKLKSQLGAVTPENLLAVAELITNGNYGDEQYRDGLIQDEIKLIPSISTENVIKITDKSSGGENKRKTIVNLAPKIANLSVEDLALILSRVNNGNYSDEKFRDTLATSLSPLVKSISTEGISTLIRSLESQNIRKNVALALLAKKETVSKEDVTSIATNIANGSYSDENYKTQFLAQAINLIK